MTITDLRNQKKEKSIEEKENYLTINNIVDLRNLEEEENTEEEKDYLTKPDTVGNVIDLGNPKNEEILEEKKEITKEDEENIEEKRIKEEENYLTETDIPQYINPVNTEKRRLLRFLLIGTGAFVLGALTRFLGIGSAPQFLKNYANSETKESLFDKENKKVDSEDLENKKLLVDKENKEADFGNWKIDRKSVV